MNIRSFFDGSVFSPERIDFTAAPTLKSDRLTQERPAPEYFPGNAIDCSKIPEADEAQYQARIKALKHDPDIVKRSDALADRKASIIAKERNVSIETARNVVKRQIGGNLQAGDIIIFQKFGEVLVAVVLADLDKYNLEPCADPGEPEGVLFVFFLIMLSCVFLVWKHYLSAPRGHFYHLSWKVLLLLTVSLFLSSDSFVKYQEYTFSYLEVSIGGSITENGRFSSLFFYQAKENKNRQMLGQYNSREIDISQMLYPGKVENKQNIHIVVLESFTDPERAKNILFNRPPLASELKPFLKNGKYFSHVMSPVYGGLSAQAEFELLSGIKAFASIGSIDFNVMKGMRTNSFVNRLRSNNYEAIATIATSSYYFNSKDAYKSLGLDEIVFLDDKGSTFKKQTGDKFIFDGDLFTYHLTRIKNSLKRTNKNIFSYTLGLYGHAPFPRNHNIRPDIIEVSPNNDDFKNLSNQFYYRTKALGSFLEELFAIDPDSIIYVTSDHLPGLITNGVSYDADIYTNISLLLNKGQFVDVSGKHYYEIPQFIWHLLTDNKMNNIPEREMENMYYKLLSESIETYPSSK